MRRTALALAFLLAPATLHAQITTERPRPSPAVTDTLGLPAIPTAGSGDVDGVGVQISPKLYAPLLWSPSAGVGLGYGVEVKNLGWPGSSVLAYGVTAQHTGRYGLAASTRTPYAPGANAMLAVMGETTGRYNFYGVGPGTSEDDRIYVERRLFEGEGRVGMSFGPRAQKRVQAFGRARLHQGVTASSVSGDALTRLDASSQANLNYLLSDDVVEAAAGAEAIYDTRNDVVTPRRGTVLQVGSAYTTALEGRDVAFVRTYASFNRFQPIAWRNSVLHARAAVVSTDFKSGADDIPFVMLPVLDTEYGPGLGSQRYHARDLFAAGVDLQVPVFVTGVLDVDAIASLSAYNAYDDIAKQFLPVPSFRATRREDDRYTLMTALGAGAILSSELVPGLAIHGQVYLGPEGFGLTLFNLVADLRAVRPVLRGL